VSLALPHTIVIHLCTILTAVCTCALNPNTASQLQRPGGCVVTILAVTGDPTAPDQLHRTCAGRIRQTVRAHHIEWEPALLLLLLLTARVRITASGIITSISLLVSSTRSTG